MTVTVAGSDRRLEPALVDLVTWLRIASISGDQRFAADVLHAARWLARWLRAAGASVRLVPAGAAPLVTGLFRGRSPGRPSVVYGHYDVQPPGPGWHSDPFDPIVRDGALVARGASDDKGQLFAHLVALRHLAGRGQLGTDVLVLADGAEEIGSPALASALAGLAQPARAVVISDTQRVASDIASITVSQRGLLKLDVGIDVGGHPVHPGRFGGAVVDPSVVLAAAVTRLADALDRLPAVAPAVAVPLAHPSDRALYRAGGGRAPSRRPAQGRHAWLTTHASLVVSRMHAGGPSAATPTRARATLDVRLPPGVRPGPVAVLVRRVLGQRLPPSTRLTAAVRGLSRGVDRLPPARVLAAAERACTLGFGSQPAYVRSGGSVPAVEYLSRAFGVAPLLLGLGPPDDNAHGPNERLDLAGWRRSVHSCTELWRLVADTTQSRSYVLPPRHPRMRC